MKIFASLGTIVTLLFASVGTAYADVSVTNSNSATVDNEVAVVASTGYNHSEGGRGGDGAWGARGGDARGDRSGNEAGDGGRGGNGGEGGNGGNIITGNAIATAVITNDVNTSDTEIKIEGCDDCDQDPYNETLRIRARDSESSNSSYNEDSKDFGLHGEMEQSSDYEEDNWQENGSSDSSYDLDHKESEYYVDQEVECGCDVNGDGIVAEDEGGESSETHDEGSDSMNYDESSDHVSDSQSSSGALDIEYSEDNNNGQSSSDSEETYALDYTKTYAGCECEDDGDDVNVENDNGATVRNGIEVHSLTGDNGSYGYDGGHGDRGGNGGDVRGDHSGNEAGDGGRGGNGGEGGNGGDVRTGGADSLSDTVNLVNRSMTRVVRG